MEAGRRRSRPRAAAQAVPLRLMSQRLAMSKKESVEEQLQDLVSFVQCRQSLTLIHSFRAVRLQSAILFLQRTSPRWHLVRTLA